MQRYSKRSRGCSACQKADVTCVHPPASSAERWRELGRKRTLRPFALIMFCFVVAQFAGIHSIRPYMVQLFVVFRVPLDANWTTVIMGVMSVAANVVVMCAISFVGKRRLYFFSLAGTAFSCFALSNWSSGCGQLSVLTVLVCSRYLRLPNDTVEPEFLRTDRHGGVG